MLSLSKHGSPALILRSPSTSSFDRLRMRWRGISKDAGDDIGRELVDSNELENALISAA
jgi:hypothetical protein